MRIFKETLSNVIAAMGLDLPPWLLPLIALALAAAAWPWFRKNERTKRARRMIRDAADLGPEARIAQQAQALEMVEGHVYGLIAVAEEANKRGMRTTALAALAGLHGVKKAPLMELRKMEKKLLGPAPTTLDGAIEGIRESLDAGRPDEARHHLRRALRRWPRAQPLMDLGADVARARDARERAARG